MKHWWLICACPLFLPLASATAGDQVPFTMIGTGGLSCGGPIEYQKQPGNKAQLDTVASGSGALSLPTTQEAFLMPTCGEK